MDVPALHAAANRIDDLAEVVQARAALIALCATTSQWRSPAAREFFTQLDDVSTALTGCVTELQGFAALIRSHAARR